MKLLLLASIGAGNIFTFYPGFVEPQFDIQAITDKGPVLEMIIACRPGEGIISFSKVERVFCVPDATCYSKIRPAIRQLCK